MAVTLEPPTFLFLEYLSVYPECLFEAPKLLIYKGELSFGMDIVRIPASRRLEPDLRVLSHHPAVGPERPLRGPQLPFQDLADGPQAMGGKRVPGMALDDLSVSEHRMFKRTQIGEHLPDPVARFDVLFVPAHCSLEFT